jgi:hypothetical protein
MKVSPRVTPAGVKASGVESAPAPPDAFNEA